MGESIKSIFIDIGIKFNLVKFLATRLLIQASSGGGKSYLIRKICEACIKHVQVILMDVEGEFSTLREKFPFALVGKDGEIPLSVRYAETLAHKLLETNLSAIVDLSEMDVEQRRIFAKRFFNALIESPRKFWHSCIVIVDEADFFAPEGKECESSNSMINLSSKGRKRGICTILATQRLAKLAKSATADLVNKMIGLTGQDIDRKRAGEEIGFATKDDVRSLLKLQPGEFYAIGPAVGFEIQKFKVGVAQTTHMEQGQYQTTVTATPNAIKKIIGKLQDIPEEAEKELTTKKQYEGEIDRLKRELSKANKELKITNSSKSNVSQSDVDKRMKLVTNQLDDAYSKEITKLKSSESFWKQYSAKLVKFYNLLLRANKQRFSQIDKLLDELISSGTEINIPAPEDIKLDLKRISLPKTSINLKVERTKVEHLHIHEDTGNTNVNFSGSGEVRILKAAAMYFPDPISKVRLGAIANLVPRGGSFTTYISRLKTNGYIVSSGNGFILTDDGHEHVKQYGQIPSLPSDLVEFWRNILGANSGAGRMLSYLKERYPNSITKEQLGEGVGMIPRGGSFTTYMSRLTSNGLIVKQDGGIKLSDELFND